MTTIVARTIPEGSIQIPPIHDAYRVAEYAGLSPELFAFEVGNRVNPLPEVKCGNPLHLPVCRPDTVDGKGFGWDSCDYLFVLPYPSSEDIAYQTCLMSKGGEVLRQQLEELGFDMTRCLVTHAIRFALPDGEKSFKQQHKSSNAPYVCADAFACQPKAIITFGADALKAFFGKDEKLDNYRGSVHAWQGIPVIPTISPAVFTGTTGGIDVFRSELYRAQQVVQNAWKPQEGWQPGYRVVENLEQLEALERELAEGQYPSLCIDTEFGNDKAREEFNYLLTWQVCWKPGHAAVLKLRGENGTIIHADNDRLKINECLVRIMTRPGVRLFGQHLRIDVEMPSREGINIDEMLAKGFDTMLANHLMFGSEGDESEGLDHLVRKYCPEFGAYWRPIEDWLDSGELTAPEIAANEASKLAFDAGEALAQKIVDDAYEAELTYWASAKETAKQAELSSGVKLEKIKKPKKQKIEKNTWMPIQQSRGNRLLYGYRDVPHRLLLLYACQDVDANFRAALKLIEEMNKPEYARIKALFENIVMPTSLHLLDVERQGLKVDTARIAYLRSVYKPAYESILVEFRKVANWPDFNPNSREQRASFLFSNAIYKDKKPAPPNAFVLDLYPLYNSDKYPKEWSQLVEADEKKAEARQSKENDYRNQLMNSPSTKVGTLEMLCHANPEMRSLLLLKQLSVLGQFLKAYLVEVPLNEHGVLQDGNSVCHNISCKDGRVRGHLLQTSTTGRYRMKKANLQTNPKKQEDAALAVFLERNNFITEVVGENGVVTKRTMTVDEYKDRTDDTPKSKCPVDQRIPKELRLNIPMFKSCYVPEEGYAFIEVDYKTAELCVVAFASGDKVMTEIIEEGRDLHCEVAMRAFNKTDMVLDLTVILANPDAKTRHKAYKEWVSKVKHLYMGLRTAAKTVIFGLMYGRGAAALAREIGKVYAAITREDCQQIIDSFSTDYAVAWAWIQRNMESATKLGYVETPFGRRRWFPGVETMDERGLAAVRREAANSPIQGCVADMLAVAGINLDRFRKTEIGQKIGWRLCLPVHDAFIIEVPIRYIKEMKQILQICCVDLNKIPGTDKSIKIDIEVFRKRLGELDQEGPAELNKAA